MYFSRLQINPRRREARKLLANPRAMHAAVEAAFPPRAEGESDQRILWRTDEDLHAASLYVVSPEKPDMSHLVETAGWQSSPAETLRYRKFLDTLARGQQFRFRVTVNPVKRLFIPGGRGKIVPHVTEEQQLSWFYSRQEQWGFTVLPQGDDFTSEASDLRRAKVVKRSDRSFSKPEDDKTLRVTQRHVTIVGELEVLDPEVLHLSLVKGLGRGKAYGCGLMTLARA